MSGLNPYTMNNLYNQGIIDYVPLDTASPFLHTGGVNPYLSSAMSGAMYQNWGNSNDTFSSNRLPYGTEPIGSCSRAGLNGFSLDGTGTYSRAGLNGFGEEGVGVNCNAGMNAFGGGFGTAGQNITAKISSIPSVVKGLISGIVLTGTALLLFRKGKVKKK